MYGVFLIAELGRLRGIFKPNLEYDLLWETSEAMYKDFLDSPFNKETQGEYDCISDYLNTLPKAELEVGDEVTINIPFTYEIGDEGYHSGKDLNTIEDCMDEVRAEIEAGVLNEDEVFLEVSK
jgi:hypothetical protein